MVRPFAVVVRGRVLLVKVSDTWGCLDFLQQGVGCCKAEPDSAGRLTFSLYV